MKREKMLELMELFSPVDVSIIKFSDMGVDDNNFTDVELGPHNCALCEVGEMNCDECCIECSSGSNFNDIENAILNEDYEQFEESRKLLLQEFIDFKAENPDHKLCQVKSQKEVEQKQKITIELEIGKEETELIEELGECFENDLNSWEFTIEDVKQHKMWEFLQKLGFKLSDQIQYKSENEESESYLAFTYDDIPF